MLWAICKDFIPILYAIFCNNSCLSAVKFTRFTASLFLPLSLPPLSLPSLTPIPRANLKLVRERNDYAAMGRTVGNLGNTYYLLGNYKKAIKYHEEVRWKRTNYGHTRT